MADIYQIRSAIEFLGTSEVTIHDIKIYSSAYADYTIDIRVSTPYTGWTNENCANEFKERVDSKLRSMGVNAQINVYC